MPRAPFHMDAIKRVLATADNREMRSCDLARECGLKDSTLLAAVAPGLRDGELEKRQEGRAVFYRLVDGVEVEAADPDEDAGEFTACLWTDGELDLHGVVELEGGGVRIPAAGVQLLCRLLHGQGPADA